MHAADVAHHALRLQFAEGDDLRDAALAVFLPHVFEHLAAARFAEIHVDIGRRNAIRIQEPLENQAELKRIDVGDSEDISDHRAGGRAAPGTDRDPVFLREMNEIPNDQEITDEPCFFENAKFVVEPPDQLRIGSSPVRRSARANPGSKARANSLRAFCLPAPDIPDISNSQTRGRDCNVRQSAACS